MSEVQRSSRAFYFEIFAVSLAAIVLEVSYTRIFSFKLYYYFTYLIIGIGLLGLGSGAVVVALSQRVRRADPAALGARPQGAHGLERHPGGAGVVGDRHLEGVVRVVRAVDVGEPPLVLDHRVLHAREVEERTETGLRQAREGAEALRNRLLAGVEASFETSPVAARVEELRKAVAERVELGRLLGRREADSARCTR